MKQLAFTGIFRAKQNQAFRRGQKDGAFGNAPAESSVDYVQGYETGRKFRLDMIANGARVSSQYPLFNDQSKERT